VLLFFADEIAVKTVAGLHELSVPMVSRQVSCRFSLQPYANTLGDFFKSILEEDNAIKHVHAENEGQLPDSIICLLSFLSYTILSGKS